MSKLNIVLNKFEEIICAIGLLFVTFLIFVSVVLRYVFGSGLSWSEEMVRFLMILVTFVGASICVRLGSHISVDFLLQFLNKKMQKLCSLFINIISLCFTITIAWLSLELIKQNLAFPQLAPALRIPMYIPYLSIPLGLGLCSIRYVQLIINDVRELKRGEV